MKELVMIPSFYGSLFELFSFPLPPPNCEWNKRLLENWSIWEVPKEETRLESIVNFQKKIVSEALGSRGYQALRRPYHACLQSQAGIKSKGKRLKITRQQRIMYHACLRSQAEIKSKGQCLKFTRQRVSGSSPFQYPSRE